MSYALYRVPRPGRKATRVQGFLTESAKEARQFRRDTNRRTGSAHAVHVGEDHPNELPFGERLWVENKGDVPCITSNTD